MGVKLVEKLVKHRFADVGVQRARILEVFPLSGSHPESLSRTLIICQMFNN